MKHDDFKTMWEQDGTKLVLIDRREEQNTYWILYAVHFPESTIDYGRHTGLLIAVDKRTDVILAHELNNQRMVYSSYTQFIQDWFERHVRDGLRGVT